MENFKFFKRSAKFPTKFNEFWLLCCLELLLLLVFHLPASWINDKGRAKRSLKLCGVCVILSVVFGRFLVRCLPPFPVCNSRIYCTYLLVNRVCRQILLRSTFANCTVDVIVTNMNQCSTTVVCNGWNLFAWLIVQLPFVCTFDVLRQCVQNLPGQHRFSPLIRYFAIFTISIPNDVFP